MESLTNNNCSLIVLLRFGTVMDGLISEFQSAGVAGRAIQKSILAAKELTHSKLKSLLPG